MAVTAQSYKYPETPQFIAFFQEVVAAVRELPGVESAAMVRPMPLAADTFSGENFTFSIAGKPEMPEGEERRAAMRFVSPDYFRTMGIPLLAGRDFTARDDRESPIVFIINRTAAERYWPGEDPVGQAIGAGDGSAEIVGVVGDIHQMSLSQNPAPAAYAVFTQISRVGMTLVVRTTGDRDPLSAIGTVRTAIWDIDPDQPITRIATMEQIVDGSLSQPRFSMTLLSVFAGLALVLAAMGIYGVISYTVSRRTHEIGLRLALGADVGDVLKMVLYEGMTPAATGIVFGLAGALAVSRLMEGLLFGIAAFDPATFVLVTALMILVALAAAAIPALRAAKVQPTVSLRYE